LSLRTALIDMQYSLRDQPFPVIVVIAGDDRPGCDDAIKLLNTWLDPRFVSTCAFGPPTAEEAARPPLWRFWRNLPPHGRIGVFAGGIGLRFVAARLAGTLDKAAWLQAMGTVRRLERALVADGAVLLKFWLHVPKKEMRKRLMAAEKDPDHHWRIQPEDWDIYKSYDRGLQVVETFLQKTSTGESPWQLVESTDWRYRDVQLAESILNAVHPRLSAPAETTTAAPPAPPPKPSPVGDPLTVLDAVDLSQSLSRQQYEEQLAEHQARLHRLARRLHESERSVVLLFEGWDAGGKGGAIRRLTAAINAQMFQIVPVAAPTDEERRYHYLWRFWRCLPESGKFLIFDRSWYGRVLVERVERFASPEQWQRAYSEINDFEEQIVQHGWGLEKFWLHISPDEQLRRFEARKETSYKHFKITPEDYRNRERRIEYQAAANEMIERTSTPCAPWHLIAAEDKHFARIEVLRIVCEGLEKTLEA
ncbi:MAG: polyphosphate:AMP phosphotransferase, partial [Planctomycetales bacterium]|nr:polyphosphate:AMP phosphotransferase [Planctomycetales bacterium]